MPVLDTTEFDFSQEHALGADKVARRVAVVRNEDAQAVLHVGVKSPVPWLDLYPSEFALAPQEAQALTVELRPDRAGQAALAPTRVSLFGQYLAIQAGDADGLPPDLALDVAVIPPLSNCPHCAADLPEGARECRRCGERIRLCPVCGTPNTWIAKVCRLNPAPRPADPERLAGLAGRGCDPCADVGQAAGGAPGPALVVPRLRPGPRVRGAGMERAAGRVRHGHRLRD